MTSTKNRSCVCDARYIFSSINIFMRARIFCLSHSELKTTFILVVALLNEMKNEKNHRINQMNLLKVTFVVETNKQLFILC